MKKMIIKILVISYFVICFNIMTMKNVSAYIDPSVMTYTIQAVAGIAIAIGAAIGIHFRNAKKKINAKLGIDENKNKKVETDEIIVKKNNHLKE
jgi:NADH:ubiquinone oxidoreductase subunit K